MLEIKDSLPYITGMGYRKQCDFVFDEFNRFTINQIQQFEMMKIFVKTDLLLLFEAEILNYITKPFILYTHNSDLPITDKYINIINNQFLYQWYGVNISFKHNKLQSIPIGLANRRWYHGNIDTLETIITENNIKDNLVYCNFDVKTNPIERNFCLQNIGQNKNNDKVDFETYLRSLSKSFFVLSPNGNGIDCHKHWESLYLKTIPIVTKSINIEYYNQYPFLIINSWSDFKQLKLSEDLYYNIWDNFNNNILYLNDEKRL